VSPAKFIELSSEVRLPYVEQGDVSGIPVIFLHAIADSWHSFERVLAHLPDSIHAFAVTQRGHGDASRPSDGYRPDDFAADLAAFMDGVGVEAAVIAGGSSVGFAARRFAIDHPERTLGLMLLGSPATLQDKQVALEMWEATVSKLTDPIDPGFVREFAEKTLAQPVPPAFFEVIVRENLKVPATVWKATFKGLLGDDSFRELQKITAPTLIVWGDQDAFLSRSDQNALSAAIAGSRLIVYPGAGHAVYWEAPDRVASDLVAFVEQLAKSRRP
jgi:pimeloyl-ACP methyl ester carboxylesterase